MNLLEIILFLMPVFASAVIGYLTYYLYRASKLQFVALLTSAFQDQWHSPRAVLMRDYLHSKGFEDVFDHAISEAYGSDIKYSEIDRLLEESELIGNDEIQDRLTNFDLHLKKEYLDTLDYSKFPFSAYQALYEVLLSFDRLAIFRDDPLMMDKCITRYKPPIRDLSIVLQAYIAVRILLRKPDLKNYKKDYMHLLGLLSVKPIDKKFQLNLKLFEKCKQGLIGREELLGEELRNWEEIIEKRQTILEETEYRI